MTALRNVAIAPNTVGTRLGRAVQAAARGPLEEVGSGDRFGNLPDDMPGGQRQPVAITRDLTLEPEVLLLEAADLSAAEIRRMTTTNPAALFQVGP